MKKFISTFLVFAFLFTSIFEYGALAMPVGSGASSGGNTSSQLNQISSAAGAVQSFQADLFTGRAQTSIPIFVPPGRKNVQPSLNMSYSSSAGSSWLGVGWALDLGFIQRDIKSGVPKYDNTDTFVFSFQGVYSELVEIATNEYRAVDEALFLKFTFDPATNAWTVIDKSGTKHFFGSSTNCRQENSSGTYKWSISKVVDTLGNKMEITHVQDDGEIYLSQIDYNGNEEQSFANTHRVEFELEDRPDKSFSYITGARVGLNKRLKEIRVKVKDTGGVYQLARKYTPTYTESMVSKRSLLTSVTECGTDGTTCLPATTFEYRGQNNGIETMNDHTNVKRVFTGDDYDYISSTNSNRETIVNLNDINGDGYLDRIMIDPGQSSEVNWKVQYGNETGFDNEINFGPARTNSHGDSSRCPQFETDTVHKRQVSDVIDMNRDGLPDRILADANGWEVQYNNGDGFDEPVAYTGVAIPAGWADDAKYIRVRTDFRTTKADLIDLNGDGLPDRVMAEHYNTNWKVQLNNGSGFEPLSDWGPIETLNSIVGHEYPRYYTDTGLYASDLVDLNGDGLPDRVMAETYNDNWQVQWNTGNGFTSATDFGPIENTSSQGAHSDYVRKLTDFGATAVDIMDLNGDGLPERVISEHYATTWSVQWNLGDGFSAMETYGALEDDGETSVHFDYPRYSTKDAPYQSKVDVMDLDGDGAVDRVQAKASNTVWKMQKNKNYAPDLIKTIHNGRGGTTNITYTPSTRMDNTDINGNERLPFPIHLVTQVDQTDGMGNTYTTTYNYKGGLYDADAREFRGFREVTTTDAEGTETKSFFLQDEHKKGKLEKKEVWGKPTDPETGTFTEGECPSSTCQLVLFSREETDWICTHAHGASINSHFAYVEEQKNTIFDGDATSKEIKQSFTYDQYGNLASTTEHGDTTVSGDERRTENEYVYNTTDNILNTLARTALYDAVTSGNKISERYFYYDNSTSHTTPATDGLLTKEIEWLNTCTNAVPDSCHPTTSMTYDNYGNVTTITDARSFVTTNTYETDYNLFLTQIENALTHTRQFTYDPLIAQIKTSTDQNNQTTTTEYDALGRVIKVIAPLDSAIEPTQEFEYDLSSVPNRTITKVKSSKPGESFTQLTTYSFTDGLGREIQRRAPAEDSNKQIVTGVLEFNTRGQTKKEYTPFEDDTDTNYSFPSNFPLPLGEGGGEGSYKSVSFIYDAVGRRTRIDYPDSTHSKVEFDDFIKTTTDQRDKQLRYTNDAYGRLAKVEEFNSGATYTTTYEYDVLNNLKKTTDHAGNINTIAYDSLSRKTSMSDVDMGDWSYTYDGNDNLISQTDAKSQTISFNYDALNRVTLKNLPTGETDVTYIYDSVPGTLPVGEVPGTLSFWTGRLSEVSDTSGTHAFAYDALGRVIIDRKTVDSIEYDFTRTYDSMGRVRTLEYPDTEVITYVYNNLGDVESISGLKASTTTHYVKDVDYNPSGQIEHITYGNDVTSDYTYDADTLRLDKILTKKSDGVTKLQDLSYVFDPVGNVSSIADTVNSMSQTFTYDDINRLLSATGSAYGTKTYTYDAIGNMTNKNGMIMNYGEGAAGPHAVTSVTGSNLPTYCPTYLGDCTMTYDANGNMTGRGIDELIYDSENRLKEMKLREGKDDSHTYNLEEGWNAISFTYLPENRSISSVLGNAGLVFNTDYDQISTLALEGEGQGEGDPWIHFVNDPDFNDFTEFEYGKTYEIYITKTGGVSFSVSGKSPAKDINHSIKSGDNFISPAVKQTTSISALLTTLNLQLGTDISDIRRLNATTDTWESYNNSDFTTFEVGTGYNFVGLQNASFSYGKTETVTNFVYDSTGARIKKSVVGGSSVTYLGKDYEVEGANSTKYVFLGDRRITTKKSNGDIFFTHTDHINSSNVVTDATGNQSALYEYTPYGTTATETGSADLRHKFTGQEEDKSTRLYDFNARMYDPQLGRFITPDWIIQDPGDPQSLNRYAYARNNPIRYIDPTGNFFIELFVAVVVAAAIGAVVNVGIQAAMGNINSWSDLGSAALTGAVAGAATAVGGAALGATLGAMGLAGSVIATTVGEMAVVAGSAYLSNGVNNTLNGQNFNAGGWQSAVIAAGTFGALKTAGPHIQKALNKLGEKLKPALQKLKQTFNNNPSGDSIGKELRNSIDEVFDDGFQGKIVDASDDFVDGVPGTSGRNTDFIVTPKGETIPVPNGANGPLPVRSGSGMQYQGGAGGKGLDPRVTGVRIMDASKTQGPRVSYNNANGQRVSPSNGRTISNSHPDAHIPLKG